jgi:hypothetical protein
MEVMFNLLLIKILETKSCQIVVRDGALAPALDALGGAQVRGLFLG